MITVIGRAEAEPARIPALQPALDAMMRATWDESGCLSYSMAVENAVEGIVTIVERWADIDALHAHFATPHMQTFNATIKGAARSIDVKIYDASNERSLQV